MPREPWPDPDDEPIRARTTEERASFLAGYAQAILDGDQAPIFLRLLTESLTERLGA